MAIQHTDIQSADCHEPIHITDAVMADHGKVITPSSSSDGQSELVQLEVADLSDGSDVVTLTGTQTLTNKRIDPRISSVVTSATLPVDSDSFDVVAAQDLAENLTVAAPTGTPVDGQLLKYRIREDGVGAFTIAWNAIFHGPNTGAPTAAVTTADTTNIWVFMWNATDSIWEEVSATVGIT